jgi:hypothetical protein
MNLEQTLAALPPQQWTTQRAVVLDWHDGPRGGVCALAQPGCEFLFHLFAQPGDADLLAVRLFSVAELPPGSVDGVAALLGDLGRPSGPLWVPAWEFRDAEALRDVEVRLADLLNTARPTPLYVATVDWLHFEGCWNADAVPPAGRRFPSVPKR